jgi:hypothetical protein
MNLFVRGEGDVPSCSRHDKVYTDRHTFLTSIIMHHTYVLCCDLDAIAETNYSTALQAPLYVYLQYIDANR